MDEFCYECGGYGEDYYLDENDELVCACDNCPINKKNFVSHEEHMDEKPYMNVYILYIKDVIGNDMVRAVFSEYEYAEEFAKTHLPEYEFYKIVETTMNVG